MSGGFNFNAPIGKADFNTGSGMQVTGDGANVNTGSGTLNVGGQTFGGGIATAVEWVDRLAKDFETAVAAEPNVDAVSDVPDAKETFAAMRELAAVDQPPEEDVDTVMGRLRSLLRSKGAKVVRAVGTSIAAGLQATVQTHPLVVAGMTLVEELKEVFEVV